MSFLPKNVTFIFLLLACSKDLAIMPEKLLFPTQGAGRLNPFSRQARAPLNCIHRYLQRHRAVSLRHHGFLVQVLLFDNNLVIFSRLD